MPDGICQQFARILGSSVMASRDGSCTVTRTRNINVSIMGRPSRSVQTLPTLFSYESPDAQGRTLNQGETVILPEEVPQFMSILRQHGIIVTGLHNHWLYEQPRLMYIHFISIEPPLDFARKTADAFRVLR